MGIRFEVYNDSDPSLHKLFRSEEDALNCICDEAMKIIHRPVSERSKIKYRKIEVPDLRFICRGCHKEFYQDVDLNRVGISVSCPFCHGQYYAKNCLPEAYENRSISERRKMGDRGDFKGVWKIKCPTCGCGNCEYVLYEVMPEVSEVFCPRCENRFPVPLLSGTGKFNKKIVHGVYFFSGGSPDVESIEIVGNKWKTTRDSNMLWCRDAWSEDILENDLSYAARSFRANCVIDYECYIVPFSIKDRVGGFFSMEGHPRIYYRAIGQFAYIPNIEKQISDTSLLYWCRDAEYRRSLEFIRGIPSASKYDPKYINYLSWETYARYPISGGEYSCGAKSSIMEKLRHDIYVP